METIGFVWILEVVLNSMDLWRFVWILVCSISRV